jgi:hypothetical protein
MATRNVTMVVDRSAAEDNDLGFACDPSVVSDKSYVNMYLHHDGYPEYRAVELANWVKHMQEDQGFTNFGDGSRIASHLVKDFHYNSQYLYPNGESIDHHYTYIIWTGKPDVWISCYDQHSSKNVFVLPISKVIQKYKGEYEYTDFNHKLNTNAVG